MINCDSYTKDKSVTQKGVSVYRRKPLGSNSPFTLVSMLTLQSFGHSPENIQLLGHAAHRSLPRQGSRHANSFAWACLLRSDTPELLVGI